MALKKKIIKGKPHYYLERNLRLGKKQWKTFSVYAGPKKPTKLQLKKLEKQLESKINEYVRRSILKPDTKFIDRKTALALERIKNDYSEMLTEYSKKKLEDYLRRQREIFITNTNTIEGSRITLEQTKKILKTAKTFKSGDRDEIEVINMKNALEIYEDFLDKKTDLSERFILMLHMAILKGISGYEKHVGTWREVNVFIRGSRYFFPEWRKIPKLMKELMEWYHCEKDNLHPVELASRFHARFVTIHPFADGNGRMARLLMNYILQLNSFPFTDIPFVKRDEYFDCQEKAHFRKYKPFIDFLVKEMISQFKEFKKSMRK